MSVYGILNINKPAGLTSRQVVDNVLWLVPDAKAGHAGTLDPLATGVLVVCIGKATRLIEYVQRMRKRYRATFLLGRRSTTEDLEGEIELLDDAPQPTRAEIDEAARRLVGEITQRPPIYSALKVGGRRAHKLARAGKPVELAPRPVTVHSIQVLRYEYPELELDIECGSGTYVRSLGRDLAQSLGSDAVTASLTRTAIGCFRLEDAVTCDDLTLETLPGHLQPLLEALGEMPRIELDADQIQHVANGRAIALALPPGAAEVAAIDCHGQLAAILTPRDEGQAAPTRTFVIPGEGAGKS